jgi:predicted glutamine amidotransferase
VCIAIFQPAGLPILSRQSLANCFRENDDGAGFMCVDHRRTGYKRLRVHKGFFSFNAFWQCYSHWHRLVGKKSPMVLHFRWATRGAATKRNCHPFMTCPGTAMVHNGVLDMPGRDSNGVEYTGYKGWLRQIEGDESDTSYWAAGYFARYSVRQITNARVFEEKHVGSNNKLIFLNYRGDWCILNDKQGHWKDDVWYSGYSYTYSAPKSYSTRHATSSVPSKTTSYEDGDDIMYGGYKNYEPSRYTAGGRTSFPSTTETTAPKTTPTTAAIVRPVTTTICKQCKTLLPSELLGYTEFCWRCDNEIEKATGISPFEQAVEKAVDEKRKKAQETSTGAAVSASIASLVSGGHKPDVKSTVDNGGINV